MANKSIVNEARDLLLAIELVRLGARMQVLEAETALSKDRLTRLYKEIKGASPPKGMLPFATNWFITWQPNLHASVFYNFYRAILGNDGTQRPHALVKSFSLYLEHCMLRGEEPLLDVTRAWTLVRFFESDMLHLSACTRCEGRFVDHPYGPVKTYLCGVCHPPSRAGKTRRAGAAESAACPLAA